MIEDDPRITIDGYGIVACLAAQEWNPPTSDTKTEETFGWFEVESGFRVLEADGTIAYDSDSVFWSVEYRAPDSPTETSVQIQSYHYFTEDTTVTAWDDTNLDTTLTQEVIVAFEVVEDIDVPNKLAIAFAAEFPYTLASDGALSTSIPSTD